MMTWTARDNTFASNATCLTSAARRRCDSGVAVSIGPTSCNPGMSASARRRIRHLTRSSGSSSGPSLSITLIASEGALWSLRLLFACIHSMSSVLQRIAPK